MTNYFIDRHADLSDYIVHPPLLITKILNRFVWRVKTEKKVLYLTFDDGPIPHLTEKILELLNSYNAKGTFFCVADNVRKYPEIFETILLNGHAVGNHTFSHLNGRKTTTQEYLNDVKIAEKYIKSDLFRPPYGKMKQPQFAALKDKYKIVLWDIISLDYDKNLSPEKCFRNVRHFARPGSIVVFHDNYKAEINMLYSLKKTLEHFSNLGYTFEVLTSEIIDQSTNEVPQNNKSINLYSTSA